MSSPLASNLTVPTSLFQFTYQSQSIRFTEWISLLTLCLAPLIAHIIAGVPTPIYLSRKRPAWHSFLGHFNPMSILWRYFVITDRRVRARHWSSIDMAANCALFWTSNGWDGSEEMMLKSRAFCTRIPSLRRISFASVSMATTVIVTIQGVQSVYSPVQGYFNGNYAFGLAFDSIFYSLAFLGLMRLPAALWLTEDFSYADITRTQRTAGEEMEDLELEGISTKDSARTRTLSDIGLLSADSEPSISREEMFYPSNCWRSMILRVIFLAPLIGAMAFSTAYIGQSQPGYGNFMTGTHLVLITLYLAVTIGAVLSFCVYFWKGKTRNTVVPCIGQTWYKVYTGALILLAVAAMVVSGLETRKTKCGTYTTMKPYYDQFGCAGM